MIYIRLDDVSYTYMGKKEPAVKNISLNFARKEQAAIVGLNGSGKSTLAKLVLGLLTPQKGQIIIDGRQVDKYSLAERGRKIGYVYQNPNQMLFNQSVYEEVAFGLKWKGINGDNVHRTCRELLKYFNLWHLKDEFPFNLSEGEKQMVVLVATLALKPDYLILDEPTKSIDAFRKKRLKEILIDIWKQGTGTIVISHDKEFVSGLDKRVICMLNGEVIKDTAGCQN